MSTQVTDFELTHPAASEIPAGPTQGDDFPAPERPMAAARGILNAVLMSVPFWLLFAFTLYLLI